MIDQEELTAAVRDLLLESAPERRSELEGIWQKYSPSFAHASDTAGFKMEGGPWGLVFFTPRTTLQVWILGFAAWTALKAYCPYVLLTVPLTTADDPEGIVVEDALIERLRQVDELNQMEDLQRFVWPADVPQPGSAPPVRVEDRAIVDLVKIATAFIFLHEARHLMFREENAAPETRVDEEHQCDAFARDFLLERIADYCGRTREDAQAVLDKRLMGIVLGAFVILHITPEGKRPGSDEHPPVAERFARLVQGGKGQGGIAVWTFACSLLLGTLQREGKLSGLGSIRDPQKLFGRLLALL